MFGNASRAMCAALRQHRLRRAGLDPRAGLARAVSLLVVALLCVGHCAAQDVQNWGSKVGVPANIARQKVVPPAILAQDGAMVPGIERNAPGARPAPSETKKHVAESRRTGGTGSGGEPLAKKAKQAREEQHRRSLEYNAKKYRLDAIRLLKQQKQQVEEEMEHEQAKNEEIAKALESAEFRRKASRDAKLQQDELLHESESRLEGMRSEIPEFRESLMQLVRQAILKGKEMSALRTYRAQLLRQQDELVEEFRRRGLEHWVEAVLRDKVNPYMSDALVEGTAYVVEPVLDGIEKAATLESELSSEIDKHVALGKSAFYLGFIMYLCLLFPLVVIMSLLLKIKRRLSQLTILHYSLLGNVYFGVMSGAFFAAWVFGSVDVIVTFRQKSVQLYDFLVLVHGIVYSVHCIITMAACTATQSRLIWTQCSLVLAVGLHFFSHSTSHIRRGESPHVDAYAYGIYSAVFIGAIHQIVRVSVARKRAGENAQRASATASGLQDTSTTISTPTLRDSTASRGIPRDLVRGLGAIRRIAGFADKDHAKTGRPVASMDGNRDPELAITAVPQELSQPCSGPAQNLQTAGQSPNVTSFQAGSSRTTVHVTLQPGVGQPSGYVVPLDHPVQKDPVPGASGPPTAQPTNME